MWVRENVGGGKYNKRETALILCPAMTSNFFGKREGREGFSFVPTFLRLSPRDVRAKRFFRKNSSSYRVSSRCVSVFNLGVFSLRILDSSFLRALALSTFAITSPLYRRFLSCSCHCAANQARSWIYSCPPCRALSGYERSKFLRESLARFRGLIRAANLSRLLFRQSHSTSLI